MAPSISFFLGHNTDCFVSGSLDCSLRVYNINKKQTSVHKPERLLEPICALTFSPNGKSLVVGLISGMCMIYDCTDTHLNYKSRIDCKNRRGRFSNGRKISGLRFINDNEFLCQTADSRIRIYSLVDLI